MLFNILQKINGFLSKKELSKILYSLIQPNCGRVIERTKISPYNELKPMLDEHYTLTFIKSLEEKDYNSNEITGILIHLYQYSHLANINSLASIQLQPAVFLHAEKNGKFILIYETFYVNSRNLNIININDFKFISEPIEFVEKPCEIDVKLQRIDYDKLDVLYCPEKCDQYLAFCLMLTENIQDGGGNPRQIRL